MVKPATAALIRCVLSNLQYNLGLVDVAISCVKNDSAADENDVAVLIGASASMQMAADELQDFFGKEETA